MKRAYLIGLLLGGLCLGWMCQAPVDEGEQTEFLLNRIWMLRAPAHERDMVPNLVLFKQYKAGTVGEASSFRFNLDLVSYELQDTKLKLNFHQEEECVLLRARTWRCPEEAPEGFDLCLLLEAGGRQALFYGMENEPIARLKRYEAHIEKPSPTPSCKPNPAAFFERLTR